LYPKGATKSSDSATSIGLSLYLIAGLLVQDIEKYCAGAKYQASYTAMRNSKISKFTKRSLGSSDPWLQKLPQKGFAARAEVPSRERSLQVTQPNAAKTCNKTKHSVEGCTSSTKEDIS